MNLPENLKPTPLAPLYGEGVVEWMDVFGFAIPVTWGDQAAEYRAIREDVAVIEFSMLLKYDVTGPGAADCVNRVFSRDVTAMKPGRVAYGVVVSAEGHMIDDCTVFYHGPERVMVMGANPRLGADLAAAADPAATVRECRADYAQVSVQGPKSRALLQALTEVDLSNQALPITPSSPTRRLRASRCRSAGWGLPASWATSCSCLPRQRPGCGLRSGKRGSRWACALSGRRV